MGTIHWQKLSDEYEELERQLAKANERVKELESQFETQMTNDFVTITDQAKRIAELEGAILDLCSTYHFEPDLSQPAKSLRGLLRINSKCTLDTAISSDANKFAIEKKIEALESLDLNPNNESEDRIVSIIDERIEQLRKEQDK